MVALITLLAGILSTWLTRKLIFVGKSVLLIFFVLLLSNKSGTAQKKELIDTALIPFWRSETIYNESVLMISRKGELASANLLFSPIKIHAVRNAALSIEYTEGKDWEFKDGQLRLLKGSECVYLTDKQLYPDSASKGTFPKKGGGNILFSEGSFFHNHQLAITYTHAPDVWKGPISTFQKKTLTDVIRKLKRGTLLKVLLFGDSIAAGANASGENNSPPFLPDWGDLVVENLKRKYKGEIKFTNTAVGGKDSKWGLETTEERVIANNPHLVIIAFGMNDGTSRMEPAIFKANISGIISKVRKQNSKAAFILVAPMLPNPESNFTGTQASLKKVLDELAGAGIVVVDMTAVHAELLKNKSYQDMTGNDINHPNDFLSRWYAQQISAVLIPGNKL